MRGASVAFLAGCLTALCLSLTALGVNEASEAASPSPTNVVFDLHKGHAVEELLWGVFFEEVTCCT